MNGSEIGSEESSTDDEVVATESPAQRCDVSGSTSKTYFGDVNIESSSRVHLGNNIIYNGSVVINQIINPSSLALGNNDSGPIGLETKKVTLGTSDDLKGPDKLPDSIGGLSLGLK